MTNMEKILSSLKGKILGFGLTNENYLKIIDKNKKIIECSLLNSIDLDKNKKGFGKNKKILPKKLKKIYGYKNIDTTIINENEIKNLEKKLISKFIYLTKSTIYIYNIEDMDKIIKRYNRYNVKIEKIKTEDNIILKINVTSSKNHKFLDMFYYIYDSFVDFFDMISELLVS